MSSESKASLFPIMHSQYENIVAIEEIWNIRFAEGDMRPRIEYFHDAVRALSNGEELHAKTGRLSVEHLAYDLGQLRQIPTKPLGAIYAATEQSPHMEVAELGKAGSASPRPDRGTRQELVHLYKDYTVLFAALFAEVADMNFQSRQDEMDAAMEDIGLVEAVLEKLQQGQMSVQQAQAALDQIELDELREKILAALAGGKPKTSELQNALSQLSNAEATLQTDMKALDTSHMHYVTAQLAVYEEAKDTVKRLAAQGLNLAGKFVENAMAQAQGAGRGMGM